MVFGSLAIKSQNYKHAKSIWFSKKARQVALQPHINIGVFALRRKFNIMEVWQKNLEQALKGGKYLGSEQIAMNMSVI